jgi:hypothetical protein
MKGAHALPLLLACAVVAGTGIYYVRLHHSAAPPPAPSDAAEIALFLETESGLPSAQLPAPRAIAPDELAALVTSRLEGRFGPDGLAHRSRAFSLLGLLPPDQDLAALLLTMHAAAARAWFDEHTGDLFTLGGFDLSRRDDQSTFVRLRARQLLHQRDPPPSTHPGDDAWLAREAVHAGIASGVEARFLAATGGRSDLPTSSETEREAILLSLPLYLHNLAQLGTMQGRDFVEDRRTAGPEPWGALLASPPGHTLALFGPAAPGPVPVLPATPPARFEESLGAYTTYLLLERLSDYLQAGAVAHLWRGDRYRLFANPAGEHLVWICTWATPEAASGAARLIENTLSPGPGHPAIGREPRHTRVTTRGHSTIFLNCADPATLQQLLPPDHQAPNH